MAEGLVRDGLVTPPEVPADLQWVVDAFGTLSTCRGYSMAGPGPIPWTAARDYASDMGLSLDDREEMWEYLSAMDAEWAKDEKKGR